MPFDFGRFVKGCSKYVISIIWFRVILIVFDLSGVVIFKLPILLLWCLYLIGVY